MRSRIAIVTTSAAVVGATVLGAACATDTEAETEDAVVVDGIEAGAPPVETGSSVVAESTDPQTSPGDVVVSTGTETSTPAGGSGVSSTSVPGTVADSNTESNTETVQGLDRLSGTLRAGDDPDDWEVAGIDVDFGPDGWIQSAPAFEDYDADGSVEPLIEELEGLVGTEIDLTVRYELDDDRDDADVYTISELAFRDPSGPAPWQVPADGTEATDDEVRAAAVDAVGTGAVVDDIDRENEDGWSGWDVEVRDADGTEYQVLVDAAGTVVDVRRDD